MIDTASINFGINKLSSAFSAIHPKVTELTQQFIQYKVTEQIVYNIICLILIPVLLILYRPILKYGEGEKDSYGNYDEVGFIFPTIIFGMLFMLSVIGSIVLIPDTVLAIKFPEMFAIQSMVKN